MGISKITTVKNRRPNQPKKHLKFLGVLRGSMLGEELIDQRKEDREGIVSQVVTYTRVSKP